MDRQKIDTCVEALCHLGCREVTVLIEQLEAGEVVAGSEDLSPEERRVVKTELEAIMAVYDKPCDL